MSPVVVKQRFHGRPGLLAAPLVAVGALLVLLLASAPASAHQGHGNAAPWHACEGQSLGAACSWDDHEKVYRGTCRDVATSLLCVRNQPLEPKTAPVPTAAVTTGIDPWQAPESDARPRDADEPPASALVLPAALALFAIALVAALRARARLEAASPGGHDLQIGSRPGG